MLGWNADDAYWVLPDLLYWGLDGGSTLVLYFGLECRACVLWADVTLTCTLGWNVDLVYFGLDQVVSLINIYFRLCMGPFMSR